MRKAVYDVIKVFSHSLIAVIETCGKIPTGVERRMELPEGLVVVSAVPCRGDVTLSQIGMRKGVSNCLKLQGMRKGVSNCLKLQGKKRGF